MSTDRRPAKGERSAIAAALVGIVGVTGFVRGYRLDLTWFFLDQIRDVTIASGIARGESFPLLGPRIGWTDAYLGPLYYYLLALPFALTGAPIAGAVFVAASNVVAVFLLYRFASRFWDKPAALAAAALFGVFPLGVWSSRLVWHAGLLPLFTVLFMRALFAVAVSGRSAATIPMLALLAALTQLHLATVAFVPMALLALVAARHRLHWRHLAIGTALGVLLYGPYLGYEATHAFENLRALGAAAAGDGSSSPRAIGAVFLNVLRLYQPALAGFFPGEPVGFAQPPGSAVLYRSEAIFFAAGVLITAGRLLQRRRGGVATGSTARPDAFLLVWLACPLLLLGTRRTPMWWYYFDLLYPSQFVLVGIALSALPALLSRDGPARRALKVASIGLTVGLVLSQAAMVVAFQRQTARRGQLVLDVRHFPINTMPSPFGQLASLPLGDRSRLIQTLWADFGVGADEFARRVHGLVLGLPEDNDYLLRYLERRGGPRPPGARGTHYLVARDDGPASPPDGLRSARVGPYRVVEYRPMIDYASWSYGKVTAGDASGVPARWAPLPPTWPRLELDFPDSDTLLVRGALVVPASAAPPLIAVSVVTTWEPPTAIELFRDGAATQRLAQTLGQDPLIIQHGSRWLMGVGFKREAVFDLGEAISPGLHSLEARLTLRGTRTISIDVFELGRVRAGPVSD